MFKNYFTAMCMPILMVCVFNIYTDNIYTDVIGAILIAAMIFSSHRIINGMPFSEDNILEDKSIKQLLSRREAFSEEEYKEISKPDYWLGILKKLTTIYAHVCNTNIVIIFGLILFFFFSGKTPNDAVVYLSMPLTYIGISACWTMPLFKKMKKLFERMAKVAA